MRYLFLLLGLAITWTTMLAQREITLEDIWSANRFSPGRVAGFNFLNDGTHYTRLEDNQIRQYDLRTGKLVQTILDGATLETANGWSGEIDEYSFSDDEAKILLSTGEESIYRHSTKAFYFVYDRASKKLTPVHGEGKHRLAAFNPRADKVAFVFDNDLYYQDLKSGQTTRITTDGKMNEIINGATDWVYEEEFSFDRGFYWAPDGQRIAYFRFDEREVPQFTMTNYYDELYPDYQTFKYPKVGAPNSEVAIYAYDLNSKASQHLLTVNEKPAEGKAQWEYVPRIKWTQDPTQLTIFRMNRHQSELELLLADVQSGKHRRLLHEKSKYYVDIHDNLTFLKDGKRFLWTSEQDGWNHLYLYNIDGKLEKQLTKGEWEVTNVYGLDEKNQTLYYQAAKENPMQREIYRLSLKNGQDTPLAATEGWNDAQFSSTFDYFVLTHSTNDTPPAIEVMDRQAKRVRLIEDNKNLRSLQTEHGVQPVDFFDFTTSENVALNGYLIKPRNMVEGQRYPVLMFVYGGPGSQQVVDRWMGPNYWWFQMLAQQGFVVACVDNRGTGARGEEFKKMTYLQLGHYETIDQIEAAKHLGSLDFIDPARIGIFGWSYGGYMSSLALFKGNDTFRAAVAVAPVTNWKWYDTIYTERYMRTVEENEKGYRENSPVYFVDRLQGNYLLVHGLGDDNVHFQHTAEMARALIEANKQYDTYFYPNNNHSINGGNARLHLYTKMTNFLTDKLKNSPMPATAAKPRP